MGVACECNTCAEQSGETCDKASHSPPHPCPLTAKACAQKKCLFSTSFIIFERRSHVVRFQSAQDLSPAQLLPRAGFTTAACAMAEETLVLASCGLSTLPDLSVSFCNGPRPGFPHAQAHALFQGAAACMLGSTLILSTKASSTLDFSGGWCCQAPGPSIQPNRAPGPTTMPGYPGSGGLTGPVLKPAAGLGRHPGGSIPWTWTKSALPR